VIVSDRQAVTAKGSDGWKADVEALAAFWTSDDEGDQQDRRSVEGGEHLHACTS